MKDTVIYEIAKIMNERTAKRIATTIVPSKITFSRPRRVWKELPTESSPPKAPLKPLVLDCRRMPVIRMRARTIWMIGRMFCIYL
jgi:hypothetical protein